MYVLLHLSNMVLFVLLCDVCGVVRQSLKVVVHIEGTDRLILVAGKVKSCV